MAETPRIEIRCNRNSAGSYNAHLFLNGKKTTESEWQVHHGDCDAIGLLYEKAKKAYPSSRIQLMGLDKMCLDKILRA